MNLKTLFYFLVAMAVVTGLATSAHATGGAHHNDGDVSQSQEQASTQSQSADNAVSVDSGGASFGVVLGGGTSSGGNPTAPCTVTRPSWIFGARGGKSVIDAECWAEYVKQAEHAREMERLRLELERDRLRLETLKLEQCLTCASEK